MKTGRCPTCREPVDLTPANPLRPFCSERCRDVDLYRWLNEDYAIPGRPAEPEELAEAFVRKDRED